MSYLNLPTNSLGKVKIKQFQNVLHWTWYITQFNIRHQSWWLPVFLVPVEKALFMSLLFLLVIPAFARMTEREW